MADVLAKIYYDIKNPASFGGVKKLSEASKIPYSKVKQWLMEQDTYTLHKPLTYKFLRRKTVSRGIGELIQCDLVDMSKFSRQNNGVKYLLTAIDVFSKKAYIIPIKRKNSMIVANAMKKLIRKIGKIVHLQTDLGKEFYNKHVKNVLKHHNIKHYSTESDLKAAVIERFNRTLKYKLYRIFTYRNSVKYIDVLNSVLVSYNNSIHTSTGYAPNMVTSRLESSIFKKMFGNTPKNNFKFNVGDKVRISKLRKSFHRGYLPAWSDEVFHIKKRFSSSPPTYVLKDLKEEEVRGRFYEPELQKIIKRSSDFWQIEKILKSKIVNNKEKEFYVKWKGFDNRFNSWIKQSWLKKQNLNFT